MTLRVAPCALAEANALIVQWHRHHRPPQGMKFAIKCLEDGRVCGAAICGRPVSRMLDDGLTLEVTRLVTDGTRNACSFLLGACARIAKEMGYRRIITYTLPEEGGASLRAAGWLCTHETTGGSWSRTSRPRTDKHPTQPKLRWERKLQ